MIRPARFAYNDQTAVNNAFQVASGNDDVQERALREFDDLVQILSNHGIDVLVVDDPGEPHTPDSVFPNNWISFHQDGSLVLYPMYAKNRRPERRPAIIEIISNRFAVKKIIDLSIFENQDKFLEGTGSMVLDRDKKIAYACLSPRTHEDLFSQFCDEMNYHPVPFHAVDRNGRAIYHTNVMMCVADRYVVICMDCIPDKNEKENVTNTIRNSGKEIIEITMNQVNHFAGNMLQVNNSNREKILVMSTQAHQSLTEEQLKKLGSYNPVIHSSLNTIEANGGGSSRCMLAEIHLQKNLL